MKVENSEREIRIQTVDFLRQNGKKTLLFALLGALLGGIKTWMNPIEYESIAVIFPVNTTDNDKGGGTSPFGLEMHADQLIQILKSDPMMDSIRRYCDSDKKKSWTNAYLLNALHFKRMPNLSIEVSARADNPQDALCIAQNAIAHAAQTYNAVIRQATMPMMENARNTYFIHKKEWQKLSDSIQILAQKLPADDKNLLAMNQLWETKSKTVMDLESKYEALRLKYEKEFVPVFVLNQPRLPTQAIARAYLNYIFSGAILSVLVLLGVILGKRVGERANGK